MLSFHSYLSLCLLLSLLIPGSSTDGGKLQYDTHTNIEKKAAAETVLIGLQLLEASIMIYRGEDSCSDAVSNMKMARKDLHKLLLELKEIRDSINLQWGKVAEIRRYSNRLNSSSQVIKLIAADIISATGDISSDTMSISKNITIQGQGSNEKGPMIIRPRLQLSKAKNAITVMSKAAEEIAGGLAIIPVLVNFGLETSMHHENCVLKQKLYDDALKDLKAQKVILLDLKKRVVKIYKEAFKEYKYSKELFLQMVVIEWLEDMEKSFSYHKYFKTKHVMDKLKSFLQNYYLMTSNQLDQKLIEIANSWLPQLLKMASCKRDENTLVKKMVWNCLKGVINLNAYFEIAVKKIRVCDLKSNKPTILNVVSQKLQALNKTTICKHNSNKNVKLVCHYKNEGKDIFYIKAKTGFDIADIKHYEKNCLRRSVPNYGKTAICHSKSDGLELKDVLMKFNRWNEQAVSKVYVNCTISSSQEILLCNNKHQGKKLMNIQGIFKLYDPWIIKSIFDNCPLSHEINPSDKNIICFLKSNSPGLNATIQAFKTKYKVEAITQAYNDCL